MLDTGIIDCAIGLAVGGAVVVVIERLASDEDDENTTLRASRSEFIAERVAANNGKRSEKSTVDGGG